MTATKVRQRYFSDSDIRRIAVAGKATITLTEGQSAWNPACTTCRIWGPATVEYTFWHDGGVDARVR